MATAPESNTCAACNKVSAKYFCTGCKKYFCSKDFKEHEQQLAIKFSKEIVAPHDLLLDQIQKLEKPSHLSSDLFAQIELWRKITIEKVEKAAERARLELAQLIEKHKIAIKDQIEPITREIRVRVEEEDYVENDIDRLRTKLSDIQHMVEKFTHQGSNDMSIVEDHDIDWNRIIYVREDAQTGKNSVSAPAAASPLVRHVAHHTIKKWTQAETTVAGGNRDGNGKNQLHYPYGLCVDDDQTLYIADFLNHRVVEWRPDSKIGRVVAGGNGQGNRLDQLNCPADVALDKRRDSLVVCDYGNKRVVRWTPEQGNYGDIILSNVGCFGLAIHDDTYLYISDYDKHEVKRYRVGETEGVVVAGGNGQGNRLDQLSNPKYITVDRYRSVYVSDYGNHRVVKWMEGAKQGIVVAGGQGRGYSLTQLSNPMAIVVDEANTVYVADFNNNRVVSWAHGANRGNVIIGGNDPRGQPNKSFCPTGLAFDRHGNLYVSDLGNSRVQKHNVDQSG